MSAGDRGNSTGGPGAPLPRALLLTGGLAGLLVLAIGIAIVAVGPRGIGIFVIVCVPLGWLLALGQITLIRRRRVGWAGPGNVPPDAAAPGPLVPAGSADDSQMNTTARRWIGGFNVPAATGRASATFTWGQLELRDAKLTFSIKGRIINRLFGVQSLTVTPLDRVAIFPVRGLTMRGIGIQPAGQDVWYFRTRYGDEILAALREAGFAVAPERDQDTSG